SEILVSKRTDKSFIGTINGPRFELISSLLGFGAFCVMRGELDATGGKVKVEVHKVFKVLLTILMGMPVVAFFAILFDSGEFQPIVLLQLLFIRFVLIELMFRFLSKDALRRLTDVLDLDSIESK